MFSERTHDFEAQRLSGAFSSGLRFAHAAAGERPSGRGVLSLVSSVFLIGAFWAPTPPPTGFFGTMDRGESEPLFSFEMCGEGRIE